MAQNESDWRELRRLVHSCLNVRDLGGYGTPHGPLPEHRFVRCGSTRSIDTRDLERFRAWGVSRVLDLRSRGEAPYVTCRFSRECWVEWKNVPLYDFDISAPTMLPDHDVDNYLVSSYLHMLTARDALRSIFEFFGAAAPDDCILFHCAAGMDRTGIVAMLLLGLAEVPREQIIADYAYSFATRDEVDAAVASGGPSWGGTPSFILRVRLDAIATVYDALIRTHGSTRAFLDSCGIGEATIDAVYAHLLG